VIIKADNRTTALVIVIIIIIIAKYFASVDVPVSKDYQALVVLAELDMGPFLLTQSNPIHK